mgnify:CR=1 FL=1
MKWICFPQKTGQSPPPFQLHGINHEYISQAKFLGVIFNQHDYLSKSFRPSESSFSSYLGSRYPNPHSYLQNITTTQIDYGAVAYSACRPRLLIPRVTLQNSALRIALGPFGTSPVISLYSIAKEPPLLFRFKNLQLSFAANTSRNPRNVLQHVFNASMINC